MGVYADYVDVYSELADAYQQSGPPDYAAYVDKYTDLLGAYLATGADNYDAYVKNNADLEKAYNNRGKSKKNWDRTKWGKWHVQTRPPQDTRPVPKDPPTQTKEAWGKAHADKYNDRPVPKSAPTQTKEQWGANHWTSIGKNEARVLPGPVVTYSNGTLGVNTDLVGNSDAYNAIKNVVDNFNSGKYTFSQLASNLDSSIASQGIKASLAYGGSINTLASSYENKILNNSAWNPDTEGLQPPVESFDASYYAKTPSGAQARQIWYGAQGSVCMAGVCFNNYDITAPYGNNLNTYYHKHYTTVGGPVNKERGNDVSPEALEQWRAETGAGGFVEKLTDAEKQAYRDQVLGITGLPGEEQLVLAMPEYDDEGNLINTEEVDTLLERKFSEVLTGRDLQKEKQLGALAQDVLKTSINELKAAKLKESNLAVMKNLPGYDEILSINSTLSNSILGDTGLGGLLSLTGDKGRVKSDLEKSVEKITGVSSNSTLYNWQKWFEDTLVKRYEDYEYDIQEYTDAELKDYQQQAKEEIDYYNQQVKEGNTEVTKPLFLAIAERYGEDGKALDINNIDDFKKVMFNINLEAQKEFVGSFINKYLKPRFDQSKSMDEFISYLDVKEDEQNVFQSQTIINKLKQIADLRAKGFIDLVNQSEKALQNFNADFYFDPVQNNTKEVSTTKQAQYQLQKDTVAADFENAKKGITGNDGINWAVEAYRYGLEGNYTTNEESFAKLHYQVKGRFSQTDANGNIYQFDPAEDILPYEELEKKIKNFGAEMALRKELYGDAGFMQFVTPEEYADYLLKSVDPTQNKEEWKKILDQLGLDYTEDIQQVKDYLIEAFRTEEAKTIRENIKYLNEAQEDLTQEKLGVSYIERPEDKKEYTEGQTALYNIFKNAGYGGTENDFYSDFMPDVDRSEQELIAQTMTEKGLTFEGLDAGDPLSAFTNLSGLFGDDGSVFEKDETADKPEPSYFNIFGEDEEELPQKSKAAESFLGEFTSMFAGFK